MISAGGNQMLGLGAVSAVALTAVFMLLRLSDGHGRQSGALLAGYPLDLFPHRDLTAREPLSAFATTQLRLLAMYKEMSTGSDAAIWLHTFLGELREIMDTAYRVTVACEAYGPSPMLDWLVVEVRQIEGEVAAHVAKRLLMREGDAHSEFLSGRLATLRLCVRELGTLP